MRSTSVGVLGLILILAASPCRAQSQDAGNAPASNPPKANAPADSSTANPAPEKKKTKKVWTNDEMGSLNGSISVVGDGKSSGSETQSKRAEAVGSPSNDARQRQIETYRSQIQQIRAHMDAIDKRIAQLKNFKGENSSPSGGININQGYNMVPLEDQVKQLEEQKKKLEAKIDDIEVEARKSGIDSGDLR